MSQTATKAVTTTAAQGKKTAPKSGKKAVKTQVRKAIVVKQCLGIDVSKDRLQICFRNRFSDNTMVIKAQKSVKNDQSGWKAMHETIKKNIKTDVEQGFVVVAEATGVYHESACYHLHNCGYRIVVLLPNKSKNFAKSLNTITKTDKIDAQILAQMGLERNLEEWVAPNKTMLIIKDLTREREDLSNQKTVVKNQLHALEHSHEPNKKIVKRYEKHIQFLEDQIDDVEAQLRIEIDKDDHAKTLMARIQTIKGIAFISAATIIGETNGFANFTSRAQVASYAGYDVIDDQSGKHTGKTKISKRGNAHIRRIMHYPALTAAQHDPTMKALKERIVERTQINMKAYVAIQKNYYF
jgi:transposase